MKLVPRRISAALFAGILRKPEVRRVYYICDKREWATRDDGQNITREIRTAGTVDAQLRTNVTGIVHSLVHFGSLPLTAKGLKNPWSQYNQLVSTVFHGDFGINEPAIERNLEIFLNNAHRFERVVTSCSIMTERLLRWGIQPSKLSQIPLGVDVAACEQGSQIDVTERRRRLGISDGEFCVGSWQKDGVGWCEGYEPKWIKGPDVLVEVLARLKARGCKVRVLLTGPARGYVKRALEAHGIPYVHRIFEDRDQLRAFMKIADLCLVTSREEGGPKAVLEAMALGVPLVSTRVGLAPDVIEHRVTGLLTSIDDIDGLAEAAMEVSVSPGLARELSSAARVAAKRYDWGCIADRYLQEVYVPLLRPE